MQIAVRFVRAGEWAIWRDLRLRALAESPEAFAHSLDEERAHPDQWWIDIVGPTVHHPRGGLWFGELDSEPVGMVFARIDESLTTVEMGAMWVDPVARGLGLGKALLDQAITWGRGLGATQARLWVATANPEAAGLYRSRGFVASGQRKPLRADSSVLAVELETSLT